MYESSMIPSNLAEYKSKYGINQIKIQRRQNMDKEKLYFIDNFGNAQRAPYQVVSVAGKPYLYFDMRIKSTSIPKGLKKFEAADDGWSGRMCRVACGIMANFLGTLVEKEEPPFDKELGQYYPEMDEEYDRARNEYEESISDQDDYDELMEKYDEENFPEDKDGAIVGYADSVEDYIERYDELTEMCGPEEG